MSYFAADRSSENERLMAQSRLFDPLTRRVLEVAGLVPGMRVLDLGSGAGNVARLAADLVGPAGKGPLIRDSRLRRRAAHRASS